MASLTRRNCQIFNELLMKKTQKEAIIECGREFFKKTIKLDHIKSIEDLRLKDFKLKPTVVNCITSYTLGRNTPKSVARALIHSVILETYANKISKKKVQRFVSKIAEITCNTSNYEGIDMEFIDAIDGRKKYCQVLPSSKKVNMNDNWRAAANFRNITRQYEYIDDWPFEYEDLIVGTLYGEYDNSIVEHRLLQNSDCSYFGADFWEHLTGDKTFYYKLTKTFSEVLDDEDIDGAELIREKITEISQDIKELKA